MIQKAIELIKKYDKIIIHRHTNPDGDAIGSQVGLRDIIKHNFPNKNVYIVGDDPKRFGFVEGSTPQTIDDSEYDGALAIVLDTSAKSLISDNRYTLAKESIRIDHHIFVEDICDVDIDETSFESCAGLIAYLAGEWGLDIPQSGAQALYTGMVTDSGRFRYDSTTPRTLRIAADLLEKGVNTGSIFNQLYVDDLNMIKLRASFVLSVNFTPNNVAYIYTPIERVRSLNADGVSTFAISRGMVNTMGEIRGVNTWVNFTESEDGVLCEIRSKTQNINTIAVKYGGGGHLKASGATLKDKAEAMQMLDDLDMLTE